MIIFFFHIVSWNKFAVIFSWGYNLSSYREMIYDEGKSLIIIFYFFWSFKDEVMNKEHQF